jgi:hypothetical protein
LHNTAHKAGWIDVPLSGNPYTEIPKGTNLRQPFKAPELDVIFSDEVFRKGARSVSRCRAWIKGHVTEVYRRPAAPTVAQACEELLKPAPKRPLRPRVNPFAQPKAIAAPSTLAVVEEDADAIPWLDRYAVSPQASSVLNKPSIRLEKPTRVIMAHGHLEAMAVARANSIPYDQWLAEAEARAAKRDATALSGFTVKGQLPDRVTSYTIDGVMAGGPKMGPGGFVGES